MFTLSYSSLYLGSTIRIERVSPEVIILCPPEKLVIEVRVSGDYEVLIWNKGTSNQPIPGLMEPQELPNFYQTFVRDNTTVEDVGIYIVTLHLKLGTSTTYTLIPTGGIDFAVIQPGTLKLIIMLAQSFKPTYTLDDANTTALSDSVVIIDEGDNGTISCRSVGAPIPSIIWEFNNQTTVFEQTDTVTPHEATLTSCAGNRVVDLTPGNIVSTLHIESAQYPDHDGVYTCIGTNADDLDISSSIAIVTVQVKGELSSRLYD